MAPGGALCQVLKQVHPEVGISRETQMIGVITVDDASVVAKRVQDMGTKPMLSGRGSEVHSHGSSYVCLVLFSIL